MSAPPHAWQRLNPGISQEHAHQSYNNGRMPYAPAGRFGHSTAVHNDSLYLYGGHDGGISRHGRQNYEPGYDFDELWRFSVPERAWRLIVPPPASPNALDADGPGKRYLHATAIVGEQLFIYGGLAEGQGDVWAFNFESGKWARLLNEVSRGAGGPGRRVGHSISAVDQPSASSPSGRTLGFLLLGGRYVDADGSTALDATPFFFDLSSRSWRSLHSVGAGAAAAMPGGRKYHAEASVWAQVAADGSIVAPSPPPSASKKPTKKSTSPPPSYVHVSVLAGGTVTTPGLTCTGETWAATLDCDATEITWQRLPDLPTAIYDVRGAVSTAGVVFMYGGHLCTDSKGDAPFFYTNTVSKLNLVKGGFKLPRSACRVEKKDLSSQRGQGDSAADGSAKEL